MEYWASSGQGGHPQVWWSRVTVVVQVGKEEHPYPGEGMVADIKDWFSKGNDQISKYIKDKGRQVHHCQQREV